MKRTVTIIRTLSGWTATGAIKVNLWADVYLHLRYGPSVAYRVRSGSERGEG